MSVPSGRRGESDLLVHQKADELAKYTLHITENEKVFDPRQAMLLGMITESALHCNELMYLIRLSGPVFHLKKKRVGHWAAMTAEVRNLARGWREKDAARYKKKLNL